MTIMMSKLYAALKAGNVETDLAVLKWMVSTNVVLTLIILLIVLSY